MGLPSFAVPALKLRIKAELPASGRCLRGAFVLAPGRRLLGGSKPALQSLSVPHCCRHYSRAVSQLPVLAEAHLPENPASLEPRGGRIQSSGDCFAEEILKAKRLAPPTLPLPNNTEQVCGSGDGVLETRLVLAIISFKHYYFHTKYTFQK